MKVIISEENMVIYIDKKNINFDVYEKKEIELYLKNVILDLKRKKHYQISGMYTARVYQNKDYGLIIELNHESDIDFFKDLIDIKVVVEYNSNIFYEISDYFLLNNKNVYFYNNKFYVSIKELDEKERLKLSEFSRVIYGEELSKIKKEFILV